MSMKRWMLILVLAASAGCTSIDKMGLIAKSSGDSAQLLASGRKYEEVGPVEGRTCRCLLFSFFSWGDSSVSTATDLALIGKGDAIVNATIASSLYSYIPIYDVFTVACTKVQGTAVRFK